MPNLAANVFSSRFLRALVGCAIGLAVSDALSAMPLPLKISGTQLLNSKGEQVRLRGVNCAGMEWKSDGEGHISKTVETAVKGWHANLIRLPLSQDRWFGKAPEQKDDGASYRALVRRLVDFCAANNTYIILDLHWSDAGVWGKNIGQHDLPDKNSIEFWNNIAPLYANNPAVLFDLYNEPSRITWDEWFKGGRITETDAKTGVTVSYDAVGMLALVQAIRSTGAKNVLVASGLNWAYEQEGIPGRHELSDPTGNGIIYAAHPYPHAFEHVGFETIAQWTARMETFTKKLPLIVTEFGSEETNWPFPKKWNYNDEKWTREMLRVLEEHHWNWTAWDFHPAASPCLIANWNYTPTPQFGRWVNEALAKNLEP